MDRGTNDFLASIAKDHLPNDATVFDVGANIGLTSSLFSLSAPEGRIYSFEPSPNAYPCLQETIKANGLTNVTLYNLALGAEPGELSFADDHNSASASHLVVEGDTLGHITGKVPVRTLDEIAKEANLSRLDLIKIDVEGFEVDVLEGAKETLKKFKPLVFLEFNSFTLQAYRNISPRQVLEILTSAFEFVYYRENGEIQRIEGKSGLLHFLHMNLAGHGCVHDLVCTSRRGGLYAPYEPATDQTEDLQQMILRLEQERDRLRIENNQLKTQQEALLNSTSWRLTSPLRMLKTGLGRDRKPG